MKISKYNSQNRFLSLNTFLMTFYFLFLIFAVYQHQKEWGVKETEKNKEIKNLYFTNHDSFHHTSIDMKVKVYSFDKTKVHSLHE